MKEDQHGREWDPLSPYVRGRGYACRLCLLSIDVSAYHWATDERLEDLQGLECTPERAQCSRKNPGNVKSPQYTWAERGIVYEPLSRTTMKYLQYDKH